MGRSLQLLTQVGSTQFSKCVSLPSSSSSSSAHSLRTLTFTRKSVKRNVVVSSKGSAPTTGHALTLGGTGRATRAMTAMTGVTTARAGLTTTTRGKLRLTPLLWLNPSQMPMLTPTMATMGTAWDTPMGTAWDTHMDTAWGTTTGIP